MNSPTRPLPAAGWEPVNLGPGTEAAAAEIDALGTVVRVALWPPRQLGPVTEAVGAEVRRLDRQASRFRADSEISRLHARGGGMFLVSEGLAEVVAVALAAARFTDGLVDPTVGQALVALGYDRDFASLGEREGPDAEPTGPAPGFEGVSLEGRILRLAAGVLLDLGATAKGLGADRAALAALAACEQPGGVLVSLGGDLAVAGEPPVGGWAVRVSESTETGSSPSQVIRLAGGGLATSTTTMRRWRHAGGVAHHIVDPRTGRPADGPWRTATVAAATCAEANAASTAALIAGAGAVGWLESVGLPACLVALDGSTHLLGSWPEGDGCLLEVPAPRMAGQAARPLRRSVPALAASRR